MGEREPKQEPIPESESILDQEVVEPILAVTKEFLKTNDYLGPALFLRLKNDEETVVPLPHLSELKTTEERRSYFSSLSASLKQAGEIIHEAVFVSQVWYVEPEEEGAFEIAPSRHLKRKEAISIVGRDSEGKRFTYVLQPFSRDSKNRPVFEPMEADYNIPAEEGQHSTDLIDHLFD